jgi:hypothetical protein
MRSPLRQIFAPSIVALLLAGCAGGGGSSPAPAPISSAPPVVSPINGTLALVMNVPWTDAGMVLAASTPVTITATGEFNRETGKCAGTCVTTPAGSPWSTCATEPPPAFTAPGLRCWSLIGKVGISGAPFLVGTSLTFTPASSGELYLGINDNYYPDDTGNWTATVKQH